MSYSEHLPKDFKTWFDFYQHVKGLAKYNDDHKGYHHGNDIYFIEGSTQTVIHTSLPIPIPAPSISRERRYHSAYIEMMVAKESLITKERFVLSMDDLRNVRDALKLAFGVSVHAGFELYSKIETEIRCRIENKNRS